MLTRHFGRPWVGYVFISFIVLCALAGGASRIDTLAQPLVQLGSVAMIAVALAVTPLRQLREIRGPLLFAAACVLLVAIQLIPLPPGLWTGLPGREFYAQGAVVAGIDQPWRPISLSPDLTWASLVGLLPPIAAMLGLYAAGWARSPSYLALFVVIATLSAALGLAQIGGGEGSPLRFYAVTNPESPVGIFANRNHQAILVACAIPIVACWARLTPPRRYGLPTSLVAVGLAAFLIPVMLLTGSRSGMGLAVIGIFAGGIFLFGSRRGQSGARRAGAIGISAALLGAVALLSILLSRAVAVERLIGSDLHTEDRVLVIEPGLRMMREFFPFGSGFGTFDPAFRRFEPFGMLSRAYMNQAHVDLLQLGIEAGAFGLALLVIYLGWWGWRAFRLWRRPPEGEPAPHLARLGSVVSGMILLVSLGEYPLRTPFFAVFFVIASMWMLDRGGAAAKGR